MRLSTGPTWRYTEGTLASSAHGGQEDSARSAAYLQNWKSAASPAARRSTPAVERRESFRLIPIDFEGGSQTPSPPLPNTTRFRPMSSNGNKLVGIVEPIRSETPLQASSRRDFSNGPAYKNGCGSPDITPGDHDNFSAVRTITFRENDCPPPPPRRRMSLSGQASNNHRVPLSNGLGFPENLDDAIIHKDRNSERHAQPQPTHLAEPVSWFDSRSSSGGNSRPVGISGDYVVIPIEYIKSSPYAHIAGSLGRDIRRTFSKFFVPGRYKTDEPPDPYGRGAANFRRRNSISASDLKYSPKPRHKVVDQTFQPSSSSSSPYLNARHRPLYQQSYQTGYHQLGHKNNGTCDPGDDFAAIVSQINSLCSSDTNLNNDNKDNKHSPRSGPEPSVHSSTVLPDKNNNDRGKQIWADRRAQVSSIVIPPRAQSGHPPPDLRLVEACADLSVSDRVRTFENRATDPAATPPRTLRRSASFLSTLTPRLHRASPPNPPAPPPKSILKNPPPEPAPSAPAPKSVRFDDTVRRQFFRVNSCEYDCDCGEDAAGVNSSYPEASFSGDARSYVIPRPKISSGSSASTS